MPSIIIALFKQEQKIAKEITKQGSERVDEVTADATQSPCQQRRKVTHQISCKRRPHSLAVRERGRHNRVAKGDQHNLATNERRQLYVSIGDRTRHNEATREEGPQSEVIGGGPCKQNSRRRLA